MSPVGDEDLRRLFGDSRASREDAAPPFHELVERGRSRTGPARVRLPGLVLTATAILVFAASLALLHRRPQPGTGIWEWKAPTDFLLETSYPDLLDATPAVLEAMPDYAPLLANEKGPMS